MVKEEGGSRRERGEMDEGRRMREGEGERERGVNGWKDRRR